MFVIVVTIYIYISLHIEVIDHINNDGHDIGVSSIFFCMYTDIYIYTGTYIIYIYTHTYNPYIYIHVIYIYISTPYTYIYMILSTRIAISITDDAGQCCHCYHCRRQTKVPLQPFRAISTPWSCQLGLFPTAHVLWDFGTLALECLE